MLHVACGALKVSKRVRGKENRGEEARRKEENFY
jgi:hypothetical protein